MSKKKKENTYSQNPGKAPPQAPNNKKKDNSPKERPPKGNRPTQAKHKENPGNQVGKGGGNKPPPNNMKYHLKDVMDKWDSHNNMSSG